jgi:hypothetical protein
MPEVGVGETGDDEGDLERRMRDPLIEKKIRFIDLFLDNWKRFHALAAHALNRSRPEISITQEREFTDIRGFLLEEYSHIFEQLGISSEIQTSTRQVLTTAGSLNDIRQLGPEVARRMENQWNDVFTRMETNLGQLKVRKTELARKSVLSVWLSNLMSIKAF